MDGITLRTTPSSRSSYIQTRGNFSLLRERLPKESDPETLQLFQHLLAYIESRHTPTQSRDGSTVQYAEVRINCGAAYNARMLPVLHPAPLECEIVLSVRQPGHVILSQEGDNDAQASRSEAEYLGLDIETAEGRKHDNYKDIDRWISSTPVLLPNPQTMAPPTITPAQRENAAMVAQQIRLPSIQLAMKDVYEQHLNGQNRLPPMQILENEEMGHSSSSSAITTISYQKVQSIRSHGWSSRSSSSKGQNSNPGSQWEGAFSVTTNSGFASGIHHTGKRKAPKEGYESRKRQGTVGRIGSTPIRVPSGLADAARGLTPSEASSTFDPAVLADSVPFCGDPASLFTDLGLPLRHSGFFTPPLYTISERDPEDSVTFAGPATADSQKRFFCKFCYVEKDGFPNSLDLEVHNSRAHGSLVEKFVCVEPADIKAEYTPIRPLATCVSCSLMRKRYQAHYNAAAHLRRAHFWPEGEGVRDWPPLSELKRWMVDVMWPVNEDREEDCVHPGS